MDRLNVHLGKISKLEKKIERYDHASEWKRIFMGGMMVRAFWEVKLMIEMDAYIELDLCGREESQTITTKQNA
ncbi:MAG: hypothetical protein LCH91_13995 [Bacteroidetes bacterium]|nr:hypothetical protein [Bacteroidota bacterium]